MAKPVNDGRVLRLEITRGGGGLHLRLLGPDRIRVELQSSTLLGQAEWKPVQTMTLMDGQAEWSLPDGAAVQQFYRLRELGYGE